MATSTFFSTISTDGYIQSASATYATANSGGAFTVDTSGTGIIVGQLTGYNVYQGYIGFDTSSIPDTDVVSSVTLSLNLNNSGTAQSFTLEARAFTWGQSLSSADWTSNPGASTLLATKTSASLGSVNTYQDFTSDAAFPAAINKTGYTEILLTTDQIRTDTAPTNNQYAIFWTNISSSSWDPKLVVVHAAGGPQVDATLSAPLGGLTASMSATPTTPVNATLDAALGPLTATITATVATPPPVTISGGTFASTQVGRFTSSVTDVTLIPRRKNISRPIAVYLHGAGGSPAQHLGGDGLPNLGVIIRSIAEDGWHIVSPDHGIFGFGNSTSETRINNAITWARANLDVTDDPPVMIGASMGAQSCLTYAYDNAVACVVGFIPLIDLAAVRAANELGLRAAIDAAWGVTYPAALPTGSDPNSSAVRTVLAGVPQQHWYGSADNISVNIGAYAAATGAEIHNTGPFGHSDEPMGLVDIPTVLEFIYNNT